MLGGHLEAGPTPGNEFLVTAALPLGADPSAGGHGPEDAT
jgi:hypothetical protein